nr:hypothetical protein [Tanacetum cinerariifolium]
MDRNHLDIGIPREKRCLQGWEEKKKAYSIGLEANKEVCSHARVTPSHNDTGTPKGKRRVVTKDLAQKKQSPFQESITIGSLGKILLKKSGAHSHKEQNCSQKVKIAEEDIGSQDQKNKIQTLKNVTFLISADMSSASSAVTYTSVYTDHEPVRVFWEADEELSDRGSLRVIVYGYDGLPTLPVAPPSPNYVPGLEEPQTPPAPQDEDERSEEDPEEYEEDETEDGPVDYPMEGGYDDDDGDSLGYDADDEDEDEEKEEEEHLAPADSVVVIPIDELVSPPEGTEPPYHHPLLTPLPLKLGLLSDHRLSYHLHQRCTALVALPSPSLPLFPYPPPPVDRRDGILESVQPPRKRLCLSTLGSREVGYGIRDIWIDPAETVPDMASTTLEKDGRTRISQRVAMDLQRVDLLTGDTMTLQETIWIMEEEAYAAREAWAQSVGLSQTVHHELQTLREQVYAQEYQLQTHQAQLQLQSTLIQHSSSYMRPTIRCSKQRWQDSKRLTVFDSHR